ncbi:hypothetical protein E2C01_045336 [Portunus trituberculatus]|uniref:Uncharacterized protein n=1 Tax=Portunus trituberculatus TaxID=210409 RepID=A0A5B7FUP8_PORTR|nr:hypothetical protein [Portunus trituberculatus]
MATAAGPLAHVTAQREEEINNVTLSEENEELQREEKKEDTKRRYITPWEEEEEEGGLEGEEGREEMGGQTKLRNASRSSGSLLTSRKSGSDTPSSLTQPDLAFPLPFIQFADLQEIYHVGGKEGGDIPRKEGGRKMSKA